MDGIQVHSPSHTYYGPPLGVFALNSLFLYSDTPPPYSPLLPIGSDNFEPNFYQYKYPSNFVPVILPAYTTYEDRTECSKMSAHKIQMSGNHPKERIQHSEQSQSVK
jgi:hypothetical protein